MTISSFIVDDRHGQGHTQHGNGRGIGHTRHAEKDMEDGVYTIDIAGVDFANPTATSQSFGPFNLADGSIMSVEVREGSIAIDDVPGDGSADGALHLTTNTDNGRLRLNVQFDQDQQTTLGDLDNLQFNYFIDASSRTDVTPVIRLTVDADGNLVTTGDVGELVFEWAYQGMGATTQDSWQTADLTGDDWVAWQRSFGVNRDEVANMTEFSDWADADGYTPGGGLHFDANSVVLGYSIAIGSGNGTNDVYIDDVQIAGVTYDFSV